MPAELHRLLSVNLTGTPLPADLIPTLGAIGTVRAFLPTVDGAHVLFVASQPFSVPVATRLGLRKLDPVLGADRDVSDLCIAPDGTFVAYRADQDTDQRLELYAAPIDGRHAAVKLCPTLPRGGVGPDYAFTPDSRQVLLRRERAVLGAFELFATWIPGRARPSSR